MRAVTALAVAICSMAVVAAAQPLRPTDAALATTDFYASAFVAVSGMFPLSLDVVVATSPDGETWTDQGFPKSTTAIPWGGPGICGSSDGATISVVVSNPEGEILLREGKFSDGFVTWGAEVRLGAAEGVSSAPSCAWLPGGARIIAYRSGTAVVAQLLDKGSSSLLPPIRPAGMNTYVSGRPAVTVVGEKALFAWTSTEPAPSVCPKIAVAQAEYSTRGQSASFAFTIGGHAMGLNENGGLNSCALADPGLASDGSRFYVSTVLKQAGGGLRDREGVLYRSLGSDIMSGLAPLSSTLKNGMSNQTQLQVASTKGAKLLTAWLRSTHNLGLTYSRLGSVSATGDVNWTVGDANDRNFGPFLGREAIPFTGFGIARFGKVQLVHVHVPVPRESPAIPGLVVKP